MMRILAVDTSTRSCSVAVVDQDDLLAEVISGNAQTHSRHLMAMIDSALGLAGLNLSMTDGLAFTCGPGSFTGLRIGISTIIGLAAATRKPIVGISGLDALAMQAAAPDMTICPLIDGRRGEVYCGRYRWVNGDLVKETAEQVLSPEAAISGLNMPALFAGNGALLYQAIIRDHLGDAARFAPNCQNTLRASTVAWISMKRFETGDVDDIFRYQPMYIRRPDAKIPAPFKP
ncbi:MAG: tRNA (adenosine(37)-N6)-threonylcarbamoyltransferase complex dimerization subunit type 1 TsaB [Desulfatirhabdiaceae bacterium]|nr:tRNA (adenosine(37)-N6)-threonylcarbamoyltransferase complex dimerization subunit type 1 TsaB [Desulfatirhabdiaceae bacterium]